MRSAIRSWSLFVPPSVVERFYDAGLEAKVGVTRCEARGLSGALKKQRFSSKMV